jgi:hypothetical protein
MNNLARVLGHQKRYKEASTIYERCDKGQVKILGDEHPHTISTQKAYFSMLREMNQQATKEEESGEELNN